MSGQLQTSPAAAVTTDPARVAVEELSRIERRATTAGERRSAEWVAGALRDAGATDIRLSPYRGHSSWVHSFVGHAAIVLAASSAGRAVARAVAAAATVSMEADYSARSSWLRRLLPGRRTGTNVEARIPAKGDARRTAVVVAHHDAAHNGLVWQPFMVDGGRRIAARTGITPAYSWPLLAGFVAMAAGPAAMRPFVRGWIGLSALVGLQSAFSKTVPGANDNASGVAGALELTRRLAADPIDGLDVIVLSPGGEEAGAIGISGWLDQNASQLDPTSTLFVGLDSIGSGRPVISTRESFTGRYRRVDVELVEHAADETGIPRPRRVGLGAVSDPMVARQRGFPAVSLLAWRDGMIANLHRNTDVPANVDWESLRSVTELAHAVIAKWARS
jgi:hypothetical protein